MKKLVTICLIFSMGVIMSQTKPDKPGQYEKEQIKIDKYKPKVRKWAEKRMDKVISDYCDDGYVYKTTEVWRRSKLKVHFDTYCGQKMEVHYTISGKFIKLFEKQ